jgi:hypothetical protein
MTASIQGKASGQSAASVVPPYIVVKLLSTWRAASKFTCARKRRGELGDAGSGKGLAPSGLYRESSKAGRQCSSQPIGLIHAAAGSTANLRHSTTKPKQIAIPRKAVRRRTTEVGLEI